MGVFSTAVNNSCCHFNRNYNNCNDKTNHIKLMLYEPHGYNLTDEITKKVNEYNFYLDLPYGNTPLVGNDIGNVKYLFK